MANKYELIKDELNQLINLGDELFKCINDKDKRPKIFFNEYQDWYTRSLLVMQYMLPSRQNEFESHYSNDKRQHLNHINYVISDYLLGRTITPYNSRFLTVPRFFNQLNILKSVMTRFDNILSDITGVIQAGLLNSQLDAAKHLMDNDYLRAAGTMAGVILEAHLSKICNNHNIEMQKKDPSIHDFNDLLKKEKIFDQATWRRIQVLGDLRNKCAHKKTEEPSEDDVQELIDGVSKVIKQLF